MGLRTRWWAESSQPSHTFWECLPYVTFIHHKMGYHEPKHKSGGVGGKSLYAYLCIRLYFPRYKMPSNTLGNFSQLFYVYHVEGNLYLWGALLAKRREFTPICTCGIQSIILKKYLCENPAPLTPHDLQMGGISHLFLKNGRDLMPRDLTSCLSLCANKMVGNKCDVIINSKP
jgi:hypothetical protein